MPGSYLAPTRRDVVCESCGRTVAAGTAVHRSDLGTTCLRCSGGAT